MHRLLFLCSFLSNLPLHISPVLPFCLFHPLNTHLMFLKLFLASHVSPFLQFPCSCPLLISYCLPPLPIHAGTSSFHSVALKGGGDNPHVSCSLSFSLIVNLSVRSVSRVHLSCSQASSSSSPGFNVLAG